MRGYTVKCIRAESTGMSGMLRMTMTTYIITIIIDANMSCYGCHAIYKEVITRIIRVLIPLTYPSFPSNKKFPFTYIYIYMYVLRMHVYIERRM